MIRGDPTPLPTIRLTMHSSSCHGALSSEINHCSRCGLMRSLRHSPTSAGLVLPLLRVLPYPANHPCIAAVYPEIAFRVVGRTLLSVVLPVAEIFLHPDI